MLRFAITLFLSSPSAALGGDLGLVSPTHAVALEPLPKVRAALVNGEILEYEGDGWASEDMTCTDFMHMNSDRDYDVTERNERDFLGAVRVFNPALAAQLDEAHIVPFYGDLKTKQRPEAIDRNSYGDRPLYRFQDMCGACTALFVSAWEAANGRQAPLTIDAIEMLDRQFLELFAAQRVPFPTLENYYMSRTREGVTWYGMRVAKGQDLHPETNAFQSVLERTAL